MAIVTACTDDFFESPITDYSRLVNSISILLEIIGVVLTIRVVKRILERDFVREDFNEEDFATEDRTVTEVGPNLNPRINLIGIYLVIAGLAGQLVAQGIRGGW